MTADWRDKQQVAFGRLARVHYDLPKKDSRNLVCGTERLQVEE